MIFDIPKVPTPKKTKFKLKGSVVIQEPSSTEKPQKKLSVLGTPDEDEATDMEDIDLSKGQSSQYYHEANGDDVSPLINDEFLYDTPPVSP
ncbi:unnamed protein product [Lactuca virosa]|uniref:Uncharacterized protein n=1 Tax=Lactuca virosa TaxID=75947 RepID=A0AAU9PF25_9ASTR|nr:unnamed protein product [Lactuca virosa]